MYVPMPIRWLLVFWMFAISAISFLDRVNISIAGRFIQQEFHITDLQLGPSSALSWWDMHCFRRPPAVSPTASDRA